MENFKLFTYVNGTRYYLQEFTSEQDAVNHALNVRNQHPGKIMVIEKETILHEIVKTIEG